MEHILELNDFGYKYGNIVAVRGINLYVDKGEIVSIIGANGAGKSTTINSIAGLTSPFGLSGTITYNGKSIEKKPGHVICKSGIMTVMEGRHVFPQLSVEENLIMGGYSKNNSGKISDDLEEIYEFFPKLRERKKQAAGSLSGGEQQMLAIGRALINKPELILMDEPSLGLAPIIVNDIFKKIVEINKVKNTTILLVEQNSTLALKVSDRAYVMQNGEIAFDGISSELLNDERVKKAYLGLAE